MPRRFELADRQGYGDRSSYVSGFPKLAVGADDDSIRSGSGPGHRGGDGCNGVAATGKRREHATKENYSYQKTCCPEDTTAAAWNECEQECAQSRAAQAPETDTAVRGEGAAARGMRSDA